MCPNGHRFQENKLTKFFLSKILKNKRNHNNNYAITIQTITRGRYKMWSSKLNN